MMTRLSGAAVISLVLAACGGGVSVNTDYDPSIDFSAFHTYDWLPDGNGMGDGSGVHVDGLVDSRIRSAIDANLAAKGLRKVPGGPADLSVGYQVTTQNQVQYNTVNTGWGGGYYYGGWGMGMGSSTTYETSYTEGSLIVGLFENEGKKMVWQGVATKTLAENPDAEQRTQAVNDAVAKLMADFPPSSK